MGKNPNDSSGCGSQQLGIYEKDEELLPHHITMTYIIAKNKKDLIKTLKKTGDDVVRLRCDIIFAFPKGVYKQKKKELKEHPNRFDYYLTRVFGKRVKKL